MKDNKTLFKRKIVSGCVCVCLYMIISINVSVFRLQLIKILKNNLNFIVLNWLNKYLLEEDILESLTNKSNKLKVFMLIIIIKFNNH